MEINFYKYHGTGNDFIMLNNMSGELNIASIKANFKSWCDRRFGIGADGVIVLSKHDELDFEMLYYNADGNASSMCGNGGRCIVHFAHSLGLINDQCKFMAVDGIHHASILENGSVSLKMSEVSEINKYELDYILDTGSPHYVSFKENVTHLNVASAGFQIRHSGPFAEKGINVNFAHEVEDGLYVRTYERGVEAETYSCGTGVVAAALAFAFKSDSTKNNIDIRTLGGNLNVSFEEKEQAYHNIWLTGPATCVYKGQVTA